MFDERLAAAQKSVGAYLDNALVRLGDDIVVQAMRHAVKGGKRLRGFLALESAALYGVAIQAAMPAAAAVEAIHAYSLVHDDLPAMDDDDLRRGRPTVHVKWDDATAILAGDALQSFAFELLCNIDLGQTQLRMMLVRTLAQAAGATGMVLGQAQDIAAESAESPLNLDAITRLQRLKTGRLLEWPAMVGPILADEETGTMRRYAQAIGLAFQIADDILDIEGDPSRAGKRLQKDTVAGKATFVSLLGLEAARNRAKELSEEAIAELAPFGEEASVLRDLARFIVDRDR
ncbi:MAG: farnesyl diphosphate synthase [Pseudomonadota bacterium]